MALRVTALRLPVLFGALLAATAACGDENPFEPSGTESAQSLAITGVVPLEHPGDTLQLRAIATFSDGSTRDVTSEATWRSFDSRVVSIAQGGVLTATGYGTTDISAMFQPAYRMANVRVIPGGMFLVKGRVTEELRYPIPDAGVSVTQPDGSVIRTTTNANGDFMLPGRGDVLLRAEKDGYTAQEKRAAVDRDMIVSLELQRLLGKGSIQGWWELTFTASPSCTTLPPETRTRTYTARIWEQTRLEVELSGADMEAWWGAGFTGIRTRDTVSFELVDTYSLDADYVFIERLDPGRNLGFAGTATGTIGEGSIVATFSGRVQLRAVISPFVFAECRADDHRLKFTR
jgi:hypothetical protein